MARLYRPRDREKMLKLRNDLAVLVRAAFQGRASEIHQRLENLPKPPAPAEDEILEVYEEPSYHQCASIDDVRIEIAPVFRPSRHVHGNRVLDFCIFVQGNGWYFQATLPAEAAREDNKWLFDEIPLVWIGDENAERNLDALAKASLTFSPCS